MRTWLFGILFVLFAAQSQAAVVSFKVWKAQKIHQAKGSLSKIQKESKLFTNAPPALKLRMKQAKTNVAIARELSPNDYFILYLGPKYKGNAKALEVAARFMSRQELAEILVGYSNYIDQRDQAPQPSFPPVLGRATNTLAQ